MAKRVRYHPNADGEWVAPVVKGYRVSCCDCGLVHEINIRVVNGQVQFQAFRNARATAGKRKSKKYVYKKNGA